MDFLLCNGRNNVLGCGHGDVSLLHHTDFLDIISDTIQYNMQVFLGLSTGGPVVRATPGDVPLRVTCQRILTFLWQP